MLLSMNAKFGHFGIICYLFGVSSGGIFPMGNAIVQRPIFGFIHFTSKPKTGRSTACWWWLRPLAKRSETKQAAIAMGY